MGKTIHVTPFMFLDLQETGQEGVERGEPSDTVGRNVDWRRPFGEMNMEFPQKTQNRVSIASSTEPPNHFAGRQKLTQHCKSTTLQ